MSLKYLLCTYLLLTVHLDKEDILKIENANNFKIVYKDNPQAFPKDKSIVLFYNENELRFITLKKYLNYKENNPENMQVNNASNSCEKIIKLPPGDATQNKQTNIKNNVRWKKNGFPDDNFWEMSDTEQEEYLQAQSENDNSDYDRDIEY